MADLQEGVEPPDRSPGLGGKGRNTAVTDCIPIAVAGGLQAIRGAPESWDAVTKEAARVRRVGPWDPHSTCGLSVYVVEPGARHYLVDDGGER